MESLVDLGYPAMHRPGVELATSQSQVQHPIGLLLHHQATHGGGPSWCTLLPPRSEGGNVFSSACWCVCLPVRMSVWMSVNSITPESLEISSRNFQDIILRSKARTNSKMAT